MGPRKQTSKQKAKEKNLINSKEEIVCSKSPQGNGVLWRAARGIFKSFIWWNLFREFSPVDRAILK